MLLGRVLPVLFGRTSGAVRHAMGRDPFEGLIREHRELLSLLDEMEKTPAEATAKRMLLFVRFKRTIGKHALAEEDIIYPLLHDDTDRAEATEKLYQEHASMKIHLFELQRSMSEGPSWISNVRALRDEIEPHARQEEEIEFPKLREALSQQQTAELARNVYQEEALLV